MIVNELFTVIGIDSMDGKGEIGDDVFERFYDGKLAAVGDGAAFGPARCQVSCVEGVDELA